MGIHHFGVDGVHGKIAVPIFHIGTEVSIVFIIDIATWALDQVSYIAGMHAGHADYSSKLDTWVITNHDGQNVTIIDIADGGSTHDVKISDEPEVYGHMIQSHANHISKDGLYYYFFETISGIFFEIDIAGRKISRQNTTGGKPVQSFS